MKADDSNFGECQHAHSTIQKVYEYGERCRHQQSNYC